MAFQTASGASLSISDEVPSDFTEQGYTGITSTPTVIGEITNIGEFGKEWALVTHQPLATRGTEKAKGSFNHGTLSPSLALDPDDAGQVLMEAALESDDPYTFVVELQDGTQYFMVGIVMQYKPNVGSIDDVVTASSTIELTSADIVRIASGT